MLDRLVAIITALALAGAPVLAEPQPAAAPPPVGDVVPPPPEPEPPQEDDVPTRRSLVLSAAGTAGVYAVLYGWLSLAWYVRTTDSDHFATHDEGWFGPNTYAGGADKLGHLWGNYAMTRGVSRILRYGGWPREGSTVAAGALALAFFTVSEVKDGFKVEYGFSYGDMIANASGVALGVLFEFVPAIDRRFDLRISYAPSQEYLDRLKDAGPFNTPEDYSGQTMLLSYHLGSITAVRDRFDWVRYLDLSVGYRTRNYLPIPDDRAARTQDLFAGVSLDVQAMIDAISGRGVGAGVLHFVAEVYQPPLTTLRMGGVTRSAPQPETAAP